MSSVLKAIPIIERVAQAASADHLRVDVLARGTCEDLCVSECEVFPSVSFPYEVRQFLRNRWLYGYGLQGMAIAHHKKSSRNHST